MSAITETKSLEEMKEMDQKPKFGSVFQITKQDWEHHITNAPKDVPVIIHFYQNCSCQWEVIFLQIEHHSWKNS